MDVTLGPWKGKISIESNLRASLVEAMGDAAWTTVKNTAGFTPKKWEKDKTTKGFGIEGEVTSLVKQGKTTAVKATFVVSVDGTFSNVQPVPCDASADAPNTAEDALRALTEARVTKILGQMKAGRVLKAS